MSAKKRKTNWPLVTALIFAVTLFCGPPSSRAQEQPASEAAAGSPPPVGTVINSTNWQKYKEFLPPFAQHSWIGAGGIKLPASASITVGPYVSVPPPKKFMALTEKYAGSVTLRQLPSGGFLPENYVAGYPFPNPSGPNAAIQVVYNFYYQYKPWVSHRGIVAGFNIDRYGNKSPNGAWQVNFRFKHLADVGMPLDLPGAPPNVFQTQYLQQTEPEQSKYTGVLTSFPDDPSKEENLFIYIPALRRSLRSSASSRCSPALGGDVVRDDFSGGFNGIPSEFYAIMKNANAKMLWIMPMAIKSPPVTDYYQLHFGFPKPAVGKWSLRPAYEVELRPIPSKLPGYCYPRKILWFDKQTYMPIATEIFDVDNHFWKAEQTGYYPIPLPNSPGDKTYNSYTNWESQFADFQLVHWDAGTFGDVQINSNVPKRYQNITRYATPGGLDEIMQ